MKLSLSLRVFLIMLAAFTLMLIFQMVIVNAFWDKLYQNSLDATVSDALSDTADEYLTSGGSGSTPYNYVLKNGLPLMIIDGATLADELVFDSMNVITVRMQDMSEYNVVLDGLDGMSDGFVRSLTRGRYLRIYGLVLKDSEYVVPLSLECGAESYSDRELIKLDHLREEQGQRISSLCCIEHVKPVTGEVTETDYTARILLENIQTCLIYSEDPLEYLSDLAESSVVSGDYEYSFFFERRARENGELFFVTARRDSDVSVTLSHLGGYYTILYVWLFLILILAAYLFSKRFTAPLVKMSSVASKISSFDFTQRLQIRSDDELGTLASSINDMSANLESAISELKQKNAELEDAVEATGENEARMRKLVSDLAHEFKTPLSVISGFTEIIENGYYERDREYYFATVKQEIERMSRMVSEASALSKLESGYWPIKQESVAISDLVSDTVMLFSPELKADGFSLDIELTDSYVTADPRRIRQVLSNLISNAIKYSTERSIRISAIDTDDGRVMVEIENSGSVSEEDMQKIWERYYMKGKNNTPRMPSEGIGLDIVRSILSRHGSEYGVRQGEGKICFYFTLEISPEDG